MPSDIEIAQAATMQRINKWRSRSWASRRSTWSRTGTPRQSLVRVPRHVEGPQGRQADPRDGDQPDTAGEGKTTTTVGWATRSTTSARRR